MKNRGDITTEYTFWCGIEKCIDWYQFSSTNKTDAIKEAKRNGWEKTKEFGWICPQCASGTRIFYDE